MIYVVYYTSGLIRTSCCTGDWSNGMIGVSKTFGGSSILSSPALKELETLEKQAFPALSFYPGNQRVSTRVSN